MLLDRRLGLLERLLVGRRDLVDLEDVVAELRLDRAVSSPFFAREDRVVERLLLLALGDAGQLAALGLGGVVDRVLLGDRLAKSRRPRARPWPASALAFVLVRTTRRSRRSGWAKRSLFLS